MEIKEIAIKAHNHAVKIGAYGNDAEWEISKKVEEESNELIEAIDKKRYADIETFDQMFNNSYVQYHF